MDPDRVWLCVDAVKYGFRRFCMVFHYVPAGAVLGTTNLSHSLSLEESRGYLVYTNLSITLRASSFSLARLGHPPCPNFETHVNHHNPRRQGGLQESSSQSRVGIYWPSIPFATCET